MDERLAYLGFSVFSGIGPVKFSELLAYFKTATAAWESSEKDLRQVLGEKLLAEFLVFRETFSISDYARLLLKKGVTFLTLNDAQYPALLKQIPKAPLVLYVRGSKEILNQVKDDRLFIAVVGARKITSYGRDVTELFVRDLVASGFTIVSGLAMGVDAVAHKTTIEQGGKTIAILGCGVDCCSPTENEPLYDQILESGGVIISELPLGHPPNKGSFPARNRIIAGLSQAVLVTEGAEDSGSLITAEFGFEFNRPVFAVPGPITSYLSKGPYKLISKGAKQVVRGEEILREFQIFNNQFSISNKKRINGETQEEEIILQLLENEAFTFDEIVRKSKLNSSQVGSILSLLEVKGIIKSSAAGLFRIAS